MITPGSTLFRDAADPINEALALASALGIQSTDNLGAVRTKLLTALNLTAADIPGLEPLTAETLVARTEESSVDATLGPRLASAVAGVLGGMPDGDRQSFLLALTSALIENGDVLMRKLDGSGFEGLTVGVDQDATPAEYAEGTDIIDDLTVQTAAFWDKQQVVDSAAGSPYVINLDGTADSLNLSMPLLTDRAIQFGGIAPGLEGRRGRIVLRYGGASTSRSVTFSDNNPSGARVVVQSGVTLLPQPPLASAYVIIEYLIMDSGSGGLVAVTGCQRHSPPMAVLGSAIQQGPFTALPAYQAGDLFIVLRSRTSSGVDTLPLPWQTMVGPFVDGDASPYSFQIGKGVAVDSSGLVYPMTHSTSRHAYVQIRNGAVIQSALTSGASGTAFTMPSLTGVNPANTLIGGISTRDDQVDLTFLMPSGWTEMQAHEAVNNNLTIFRTPAAYGSDAFTGATGTFDTQTNGWAAWIAEIGQ